MQNWTLTHFEAFKIELRAVLKFKTIKRLKNLNLILSEIHAFFIRTSL